jgi:hypothetical protein
MSKKDRKGLVQIIENAFKDVPYPDVITDNKSLEGLAIAEAFRGKNWRDLSVEFLRYNESALGFFTPKAFHYFLPAFLIVSVTKHKEADVIPSSLVFILTPNEEFKNTFDVRVQLLSREQKKAVREFLVYMDAEHGVGYFKITPHRALNRFWNQFS